MTTKQIAPETNSATGVSDPGYPNKEAGQGLRLQLFDLSAERMVLGALLYNNNNCDSVADVLEAAHFYEELHQRIYSKIVAEYDKGRAADPHTLRLFISKDKAFAAKPEDGPVYLMSLAHDSLSLLSIRDMAKIIKECYLVRSVDRLCQETREQIARADDTFSATDCLEEMEEKLFAMGSGKSDNIYKVSELIKGSLEKIQNAANNKNAITGFSTGFVDLDNLLDGLHKSDLIILAARPSMGKTALAINMAINMASDFYKKGQPESVAFLSLEMSAEQLMMRIISMQSGVNLHSMRRGMTTEDQKRKIEDVSRNEIGSLPVIIDDSPVASIFALKARLRRLKRKERVGCVFIDYLQLLKNNKGSFDNRNAEITEITLALKALAKELDMPIVALSQLSRAVELREDKLPQLSDLRESGSIEQDADVVMFLYREAYYEERKKPEEGTSKFEDWQRKMEDIMNQADVIVAKHRNGPIGFRKLFFDRNTTVFRNYQKDA